MESTGCMLIICFLACSLMMMNGAYASSTYKVGDEIEWDIPELGNISYKNWAAQQRFFVGDILVFNFFDGFHNVAEVSKAAYDACDTQFPISISNSMPTYITLNSAGEHYYICTIHGHCGAGMKLAINVSAPTTATPTPQPHVASVTSAPAPAPSSTTSSPSSSMANPPSGSSTATPSSSPTPSSSSAPIVVVAAAAAAAAVPFTLLFVAFTFLFSLYE